MPWIDFGHDKDGQDRGGITVFAACWVGALCVLGLASFVAPLSLKDTELMPRHDAGLWMPLAAATIIGLASLFVLWRQTRGAAIYRGAVAAAFACWAMICTVKLGTAMIDGYDLSHDFPAGQVQTYAFDWPIDRAYVRNESSGRGSVTRYYVHLTPAWDKDWHISRHDFADLQAQAGTKADQVDSHGRFCAHVMLQKAGTAVRIVGVTNLRGIPSDSLHLCPANAGTPLNLQ